ncbi:TPA: restriction endonuclease subunit S [Aeromonas veronii]
MMSELDVLNDNHTSISFLTPRVSGISKIHKGVPKDWAKGTTKDLIDHMSSGLSRRLVEHDIGIPVLISGNIQNNKLVVDELKYWYSDDPQGAKIEKYVLNEGDILLCFINSLAQIGKPCVYRDIGRPAIYTTNLFRIIIDKSCDGRFAYYLFCTDVFQKDLQLIAKTAVNQASFTKPDFLNINICYPTNIKEQIAIANVLSDSDTLIDALEQLIAKKQAIKTATMQQLLTGRTRLPQFALRPDGTPKGYKISELGQIPEDWEAISLSALCDVRDGTHDSPKYQENGIPLVTSKNIVEDILDLSQVSLISVEDALEINKRSKVDKGDIIMSMIGTVGSAVLLIDEPLFCIKNVALFKPRRAIGSYLVQVIRSQQFQKKLEDSMDGGIQKFVSLGTLRSMEIVLPSSDEQTAIATILSDMDSELTALEQKLAKARDVKQGMMQQLLTGRIRLPLEVVA